MIIFIDEAGDAGFKVPQGSTPVFVVALVIFDEEVEAEKTAASIKDLKKQMHKSDQFEFKFNKSSKEVRLKFLRNVAKCRFRVRAIVFTKKSIYSLNLRSNKESFYSYAVKSVLKHNNNSIRNAKIRIDGLGENSFRKSLHAYLRKELNTEAGQVLDNLRFRDSKKDVLIQLADMVAGTIKRKYDNNKNDSHIYLKEITKNVEDIWEFN